MELAKIRFLVSRHVTSRHVVHGRHIVTENRRRVRNFLKSRNANAVSWSCTNCVRVVAVIRSNHRPCHVSATALAVFHSVRFVTPPRKGRTGFYWMHVQMFIIASLAAAASIMLNYFKILHLS